MAGVILTIMGIMFTFFPLITHYMNTFKFHIDRKGVTARGSKIGTGQEILTRIVGVVFLFLGILFLLSYLGQLLSSLGMI